MSGEPPSDAPDWWDDVDPADADDATVAQSTRREYFRVNGKGYWVELRDPGWRKREEIVDRHVRITDDGVQLDTAGYYADMLEWMIEDHSLDVGTSTLLASADHAVGDRLQSFAPDPFGTVDEDAEGN